MTTTKVQEKGSGSDTGLSDLREETLIRRALQVPSLLILEEFKRQGQSFSATVEKAIREYALNNGISIGNLNVRHALRDH